MNTIDLGEESGPQDCCELRGPFGGLSLELGLKNNQGDSSLRAFQAGRDDNLGDRGRQ